MRVVGGKVSEVVGIRSSGGSFWATVVTGSFAETRAWRKPWDGCEQRKDMPDVCHDRIPLAAVSSVRAETWGGEATVVIQVSGDGDGDE